MEFLLLPPAVLTHIRVFVGDDSAFLDVLAELELDRMCGCSPGEDCNTNESLWALALHSQQPHVSVVVPQDIPYMADYFSAVAQAASGGRCVIVGDDQPETLLPSDNQMDARHSPKKNIVGRTLRLAPGVVVPPHTEIWREEPVLAVGGTTAEYLLLSERELALRTFHESVLATVASIDREAALLVSSGCGMLPTSTIQRRRQLARRHACVIGACDHCLAACFSPVFGGTGVPNHDRNGGAAVCTFTCDACGVKYCSAQCRQTAWRMYHAVECILRRDPAATMLALANPEKGCGGGRENMARPLVWRALCAAFCEHFLVPPASIARSVEKHLQVCSYTCGNVRSQLFIGPEERAAIAAALHSAAPQVSLNDVHSFYWLNSGLYRLIGATLTNRFAVATHVEDADVDDPLLKPVARGVATFAMARFMNHACAPSCTVAGGTNFTSAAVTFAAAACPLQNSMELTWPYDLNRDSSSRMQHLWSFYGFLCRCPQCVTDIQ